MLLVLRRQPSRIRKTARSSNDVAGVVNRIATTVSGERIEGQGNLRRAGSGW
jgi:hypothetical protein